MTRLRGYEIISRLPVANSGKTVMSRSSLFLPAWRYASAVLAVVVCLSVRPSVYPSVTRRYCTKTAKHRITQTTPYGRKGTLVSFLMPKISAKCWRGNPQRGAPNRGRVGLQSAIFDQYLAISQKRHKIGTYIALHYITLELLIL